jgi:molybdopterin-guanine dinucleotide biosynthesis protein A
MSGGESKRMGRDKATLLLAGKPLITHVYETAKRVFADIMVVSSLHAASCGLDARVVKDILPLTGSLTGIVSALLATDADYVFVLGCDMPFVTTESIKHTIASPRGEDVIIPKTESGVQPMHALYSRSCISPLLAGLGRGHMKIARLLAMLTVRVLPPDPLFFNGEVSVFTNINTEEELRRAEKLVRRGGNQPDAGGGPRRGSRD